MSRKTTSISLRILTIIRHSFKLFTEKLPADGTLIINTDIDNYEYFYQDTSCEVITVGSDPAKSMYSAADIAFDEMGCCTYTLLIEGTPSRPDSSFCSRRA